MAKLTITKDNRLVEHGAAGQRAAALKQGYDGGWSISADPQPLSIDLPEVTFATKDDLVAALRGAGYDVEIEPTSREGAGN